MDELPVNVLTDSPRRNSVTVSMNYELVRTIDQSTGLEVNQALKQRQDIDFATIWRQQCQKVL